MDLAPDRAPDAAPGPVRVLVHRLDPELPLPGYAHPGDAGADLVCATDVQLGPGQRTLVGTGVALALPDGYAGFVHPRSGLAARHGLTVVNAPGTVDAGYRGEVMVNLLNTDPVHEVRLARGERIAQLVVQRVERVRFVEVAGPDELPGSVRGTGGHGSTGTGAVPGPGPRSSAHPGGTDRSGAGSSGAGSSGAGSSRADQSSADQSRAADSAAGDDSGGRATGPVPAEETTW